MPVKPEKFLVVIFFIAILLITIYVLNGNHSAFVSSTGLTPTQSEVWFSPSSASPDMLALFNNPTQWPAAFSTMDVFQFYLDNVKINYSNCATCGPNTYQALVSVDAFRKLRDRGKKIAIEVPFLKPATCAAATSTMPVVPLAAGAISQYFYLWRMDGLFPEVLTNYQSGTIYSQYNSFGHNLMLTLDEPLYGGRDTQGGVSCNMTVQQIAQSVAQFSTAVNYWPPMGLVKIGITEPYPDKILFQQGQVQQSVSTIQAYVDAMILAGFTPEYFHLDVDGQAVTAYNMNMASDLRTLRDYFKSKGIPFGIIMNANDSQGLLAVNNAQYSSSTQAFASTVLNALGGAPNHIIVQSWHQTGAGPSYILPSNLPETTLDTHTNLLGQIWTLFRGAPADIAPPSAPTTIYVRSDGSQGQLITEIRWDPATDNDSISSYRIDIATDSAFTNIVPFFRNRVVGPNRIFGGVNEQYHLAPNTLYHVRVRAVDNSGNYGPYYSQSIQTIAISAPSAPTNLIGSYSTTGASPFGGNPYVQLPFTDNATNESFFECERSTDPTFSNLSTNTYCGFGNSIVPPTCLQGCMGTYYDFYSSPTHLLAPNTIYYYRMRASNAGGVSSWSNIVSVFIP